MKTPHCNHEPAQPSTCPICKTYTTNSHFRKKWDESIKSVQSAAPKSPSPSCRFLGERIRLEQCAPCGDGKKIAVLGCDVHGECTILKKIESVAACCSGGKCNEFEAKTSLPTST